LGKQTHSVIPAQAGIQTKRIAFVTVFAIGTTSRASRADWIPACAGMTAPNMKH
jgi:hypothetical protein